MMERKTTKIALLNMKNKLKLIRNGYKLLKEKRNAKVAQLTLQLQELKALYPDYLAMLQSLASTFRNEYLSHLEIELKLDSQEDLFKIFEQEDSYKVEYGQPDYSFVSGDIIHLFKDFVEFSLMFGRKIKELEMVLEEVKVLNKRINYMKQVMIPSLEKEIKKLTTMMEERQREEFTRLKMIKESLYVGV